MAEISHFLSGDSSSSPCTNDCYLDPIRERLVFITPEETVYNNNASSFIERTVAADVGTLRERFINYIPQNGYVLDFGCGSGRDTKCFLEAGFKVDAVDGSEELCIAASEYSGVKVRCKDFFELDAKEQYDGIWACASVLHVEKGRLSELFRIMADALKLGGIMYLSFKYGDFSGTREGRYFTDLTEKSFRELLTRFEDLSVEEEWISEDVRPERTVRWLNEIVRKASG